MNEVFEVMGAVFSAFLVGGALFGATLLIEKVLKRRRERIDREATQERRLHNVLDTVEDTLNRLAAQSKDNLHSQRQLVSAMERLDNHQENALERLASLRSILTDELGVKLDDALIAVDMVRNDTAPVKAWVRTQQQAAMVEAAAKGERVEDMGT